MELLQTLFNYGAVGSFTAWIGYEFAIFKIAKKQAAKDEVIFVTETVVKHSDGVSISRVPFGAWPEWADEVNPASASNKLMRDGGYVEPVKGFKLGGIVTKPDLPEQIDEIIKQSHKLELEPKAAFEASFPLDSINVGKRSNEQGCPWENCK